MRFPVNNHRPFRYFRLAPIGRLGSEVL